MQIGKTLTAEAWAKTGAAATSRAWNPKPEIQAIVDAVLAAEPGGVVVVGLEEGDTKRLQSIRGQIERASVVAEKPMSVVRHGNKMGVSLASDEDAPGIIERVQTRLTKQRKRSES